MDSVCSEGAGGFAFTAKSVGRQPRPGNGDHLVIHFVVVVIVCLFVCLFVSLFCLFAYAVLFLGQITLMSADDHTRIDYISRLGWCCIVMLCVWADIGQGFGPLHARVSLHPGAAVGPCGAGVLLHARESISWLGCCPMRW